MKPVRIKCVNLSIINAKKSLQNTIGTFSYTGTHHRVIGIVKRQYGFFLLLVRIDADQISSDSMEGESLCEKLAVY